MICSAVVRNDSGLVADDTIKHGSSLCRAVWPSRSVRVLTSKLLHDKLARMRNRHSIASELESRLALAGRQVDQILVWQRVEVILAA